MFLRALLPTLVNEGHRVLLFSQSKVMLDLTCCLLMHLVRPPCPSLREHVRATSQALARASETC